MVCHLRHKSRDLSLTTDIKGYAASGIPLVAAMDLSGKSLKTPEKGQTERQARLARKRRTRYNPWTSRATSRRVRS